MLLWSKRCKNNEGKENPAMLRTLGNVFEYFTQYISASKILDEGEYNEAEMDDVFDIVNIRARELREFYGLSVTDVANAFQIDRKNYYRIEKDGWNFDRKSLYKICLFYDVNISFLFGFDEDPSPLSGVPLNEIAINQGYISTTAQTLWEQKNPDKV